MKNFKLITVVGTRPEIIRLSRIISKLDSYFNHLLIHTGQNYDYELNDIFFEDLSLRKPDKYLNSAGKNSIETIGNLMVSIDKVLEKENPNAILILGDTNSCLCSLPAKRRKIPIFHMEAGNRCFDMRVPEEINRRIVDHISDINLTYTAIAREYLIKEGIPPEKIIKTGSPMREVIDFYQDKINNSKILKKLNIEKRSYYLASFHREENIDIADNFSKLLNTFNYIAEKYQKQIIISTHPRTKNKLLEKKINMHNKISFIKPFCFSDYMNLQINAELVLSDSGTISEESSILNFPAINLRETHERPEAMEEASVILSGLDLVNVIESIELLNSQKQIIDNREIKMVDDYKSKNLSEKIPRIILSYTDYVKKFTWKNFS
tara:strand:- start:764 stop:1900 length:1137 start_codon:yes stop_codon:yes gene_type:complete